MMGLQNRRKVITFVHMVGYGTKMWEGMDDNVLQEVVHQALGVPLSEMTNLYCSLNNKPIDPSKTLKENKIENRMEVQVIPRLPGGGKRWQPQAKVLQETEPQGQCMGTTTRGNRCRKYGAHGGMCKQHEQIHKNSRGY